MRSEHTALPISRVFLSSVCAAAFSLVWNIRFAYTVERAFSISLSFYSHTYKHRNNSILSAECVFTRLCDFTYTHVRFAHDEIAVEQNY